MVRFLLAILLIAFVGGLGFYFWLAATGESSRARVTETTVPPPPDVNTGTGATPAVPPQPDGSTPLAPPVAGGDAPPPVDTGAGAPPPQVPQADARVQPGSEPTPLGDPGPLAQRGIGLPIAKITAKDIHETFNESRGGGERRHEATDIMAPKGTPVMAVDNGVIAKLFTSKPGGLTVYQFDADEKYVFYYAHLDRYAEGLKEGMLVRKGQMIGYVGITGNSDPNAPHLHFAILQLGPEKKWYENTRPVDPYPLLTHALKSKGTSPRSSLR